MKKTIFTIFSVIVLVGCGLENTQETMMSTESSATEVNIDEAFIDIEPNQSARAVFTYEIADGIGTSGTFQLLDKNGNEVFSVDASAGYKDDANNPYSQGLRNKGPIPSGMWYISGVKNTNNAIFRLEPGENTNVLGRDGFLIHGYNTSPELDSRGCIILGPNERKKLLDIYIEEGMGKLPLKIWNIVH